LNLATRLSKVHVLLFKVLETHFQEDTNNWVLGSKGLHKVFRLFICRSKLKKSHPVDSWDNC